MSRISSYGIALAWAVFLWLALTLPPPPDLLPTWSGWDKVAHLSLFAVQAWLLHRAFEAREGGRMVPLGLAVLLAAAYGAVTEIYQGSLASRTADVWDALADLLGAVLYAVARGAGQRRRRSDAPQV